MAYEATAELYKREYDLAKKRAQSEYQSRIGELATQYRQANRDLESGYEGRGILRSGEAMRGRVRLGAAEKAAQLAALTAQEETLNEAGLTYAQQLAELQAKGYTGGTPDTGGGDTTPTPGSPAPAPIPEPDRVVGKPVEPTPPSETPTQQRPPMPGNAPPGYFYRWNDATQSWELVARESITDSGMGSGQNPNTWEPGKYVSGPDRKLSNGGAVVDGIYIPPGTFANITPQPSPQPAAPIGPQPLVPGQPYPGGNRKLPNGGAVVDGIYIPPGINWGALRPIKGAY